MAEGRQCEREQVCGHGGYWEQMACLTHPAKSTQEKANLPTWVIKTVFFLATALGAQMGKLNMCSCGSLT